MELILIILVAAAVILVIFKTRKEIPGDGSRYREHFKYDLYDYTASGMEDDDSDWITDPLYSYLPGNIYHQDDCFLSCSGSDWMTDPACSYMPGNIYYDDHDSSFTDVCADMSIHSFEDSLSSSTLDDFSTSSLSDDDTWSSSGSSFDD
jgi:hypothetical protein